MPESFRVHTPAIVLLLISALIALLGLVSLVVASPALATTDAESSPVKLSLRPVGQDGSYFALTMEPGETRQLAVELGNQGTDAIEAFTYAADAFTVTNGGFGAKERGSAPTRTTSWLSYSPGVLQLPVEQGLTRDFSVTVPEGTEPGQYLTSLVLENNVAVEGSGDVALDQIIRQPIAVSIDVPGPSEPALELGTAGHTMTTNQSIIDVALANTGNTNLKPAGELTISDADGTVVSEAPITLNTFYAHTDSHASTTLAGALEPGDYTLSVTLTDATTGTTVTGTDLSFTVTTPTTAESTTGTQASELPRIFQHAQSGITPYLLAVVALLILVILVMMIRRRRQTSASASSKASQSVINNR
ncbi:MAG: putative protein of unknown function cell surface [Micrococcaceae bacterium]|jgi:hypothetical protein|nr:putative protein of unknown function cell surface [Micrococcaceae bacterium]